MANALESFVEKEDEFIKQVIRWHPKKKEFHLNFDDNVARIILNQAHWCLKLNANNFFFPNTKAIYPIVVKIFHMS